MATSFIHEPSHEGFLKLTIAELRDVAAHFNFALKSNLSKDEIRDVLKEALVLKGILKPVVAESAAATFALREMELRYQIELEKMKVAERQREREEKERERQSAERIEQLRLEKEIRLKELELHATMGDLPVDLKRGSHSDLDVTRMVRMVPKFVEKNVDKYFDQFEKVATNLKWPQEVWTTLIQSVLVGKAAEVYSALSVEDSSDYQTLKSSILRAYELVPEAYRQRFRFLRKEEKDSYVEFVRDKKETFSQWLRSSEVNSFETLSELILIEEFKRCVPPELKVHLDEKSVETVEEAAILADTFRLTHKRLFTSKSDANKKSDKSNGKSSPQSANNKSYNKSKSNGANREKANGEIVCHLCGISGHIRPDCPQHPRNGFKGVPESKPIPNK